MMRYFHSSTFVTHTFLILLLGQSTRAQPSPPGPDTDPYGGANFSPSMGVIIIVLVAALFFMGFFSIYIRHCSSSDDATTNGRTGRRIGSLRQSRRAPRGLDPEVIESFPTFDYAAVKSEKLGKGALECAVCLTEFEDDDTLRLIPKCDHVFHPECIDAWLVGHTTCPVCRCNLNDASTIVGEPPHEASLHDVVVEVGEVEDDQSNNNDESNNNNDNNESMEQPLHGRATMSRNRTMRTLSFGRPRWLNKFARSFSTGHMSVKQWDDMERFTLRLPQEIRKQIISRKLERTTSLLVLPRETSSRRGYRTGLGGFGEGSSRGGRFGSIRSSTTRSDRWVFTLAPPFFTRGPSVKSQIFGTATTSTSTTTSRGGSLRGNAQNDLNQLPV